MPAITELIARSEPEVDNAFGYDTEAAVRNLIRSVMNREFGAIPQGAYANAGLDRTRNQMIEFIMNLRLLSVAALGKVHIVEADILKVCACIRRLELQGYKNLPFMFDYVARRAVRDPLEAHSRDPLQIRHLLTFSIDVPSYEMPQEDISLLQGYLIEGNCDGITEWFERFSEAGRIQNKSLPAYLRRFLIDHPEMPTTAAKAFAFELAVMDVRLSGAIGWENSRSFTATVSLVQDRRHDPLEVYMDVSDINSGILAHQHCGDAEGRSYYSALLDRHDPADLKALEQLVFDTASRVDRGDSGPRGGKRDSREKRSWWRSIFSPAGVPAQGFQLGVGSFA